ncbi:uncharacterized protein PgNI_04311, partial [Pyricularia grisea]|uniref:Uncharacterized protein n=1 Tax=Pyricularia grisea TaxID=148305 RepID=A0A6P8BAB7_PYRGI
KRCIRQDLFVGPGQLCQGAEGSQPCLSEHSPPIRGRHLHLDFAVWVGGQAGTGLLTWAAHISDLFKFSL